MRIVIGALLLLACFGTASAYWDVYWNEGKLDHESCINYEIHVDEGLFSGDSLEKKTRTRHLEDLLEEVSAELAAKSDIILRPKKDFDPYWVRFSMTLEKCESPIGLKSQSGVGTDIFVGTDCTHAENNVNLVISELLMGLGLAREHQRWDRDSFIYYDERATVSEYKPKYAKLEQSGRASVYDFQSLTHYGFEEGWSVTAKSINLEMMRSRTQTPVLPYRAGLSATDISYLNSIAKPCLSSADEYVSQHSGIRRFFDSAWGFLVGGVVVVGGTGAAVYRSKRTSAKKLPAKSAEPKSTNEAPTPSPTSEPIETTSRLGSGGDVPAASSPVSHSGSKRKPAEGRSSSGSKRASTGSRRSQRRRSKSPHGSAGSRGGGSAGSRGSKKRRGGPTPAPTTE